MSIIATIEIPQITATIVQTSINVSINWPINENPEVNYWDPWQIGYVNATWDGFDYEAWFDKATIQWNIAQNTSDIAQNTSDIAQNASDISTNTTNIATNTAKIDQNFAIAVALAVAL